MCQCMCVCVCEYVCESKCVSVCLFVSFAQKTTRFASTQKNEFMVSFVSRRYMRVVNGSLMVYLIGIGKQNVKFIEK